jgi:hypothetical protein
LPNHKNKVHLNYYRNATEDNIIIKITTIKNYNGIILSMKTKDSFINEISPLMAQKNILIFEPLEDYILYIKSLDNTISIKMAEYSDEMGIYDILDINQKYFDEYDNKGSINDLKVGKTYIIAIETEWKELYNKPCNILLQPKIIENDIIEINDDNNKFIYITKEKEYILDFKNNKLNIYLELSRMTIESEIKIKEMETGEEVTINKNNLYYRFNEINTEFKGKISLKINNEKDALLSFIYKCSENNSEVIPRTIFDVSTINYYLFH